MSMSEGAMGLVMVEDVSDLLLRGEGALMTFFEIYHNDMWMIPA